MRERYTMRINRYCFLTNDCLTRVGKHQLSSETVVDKFVLRGSINYISIVVSVTKASNLLNLETK